MTDEAFIRIAVEAWGRASNEPGWWLDEISVDPAKPPCRTRIRLMGYDHSKPCPRQRCCFASLDRSGTNAGQLLYDLMLAIADCPRQCG